MKRGDPGYWEWRKSVGSKKKLRNPRHLWKLACDYFNWVDEHPMIVREQRRGSVRVEKGVELSEDVIERLSNPVVEIETIRPYTWTGFEAYLGDRGIMRNFDHYKANYQNRYTEFQPILRVINNIMATQKFEGAAVGIFNANIISRDLGLADKSELKVMEQPLFGDEKDNE